MVREHNNNITTKRTDNQECGKAIMSASENGGHSTEATTQNIVPGHKVVGAQTVAMFSSPTKKRKRDADDGDKVSFQLSKQPAPQLGPVLGEQILDSFMQSERRLRVGLIKKGLRRLTNRIQSAFRLSTHRYQRRSDVISARKSGARTNYPLTLLLNQLSLPGKQIQSSLRHRTRKHRRLKQEVAGA